VAALFAGVRRADEFDCLRCTMLHPIGLLGYVTNLLTGLSYFTWVRGATTTSCGISRPVAARGYASRLRLCHVFELVRTTGGRPL